MKKRKSLNIFFFCLLTMFVAACSGAVLYDNLDQEDANKVMVLLQQNGIEATLLQEIKQNETVWSIKVPPEQMSKARALIVTHQIISPRAPGLQEVYQGKGSGGWIKTPAEERARYLLALKGEIINSLKRIPQVVDVDVVLNMPEEDSLSSEKKRPTASVVIKSQSPQAGESGLSEVKIQEFVANSVEGLAPRDVSVLLHFMAPEGKMLKPGDTLILPKGAGEVAAAPEIPTSRLMGLKLDTTSRERLKIYLILFFGVLVVISIALLVVILQGGRVRQELKMLKAGNPPPAIEGQVLSEESHQLKSGDREDV